MNELCSLYLPAKPDISPSSVTMVKRHEKKLQKYFCVTSSPLTTIRENVDKMLILKGLILSIQREKIMNFYSCEEYLRCISDRIL